MNLMSHYLKHWIALLHLMILTCTMMMLLVRHVSLSRENFLIAIGGETFLLVPHIDGIENWGDGLVM